MPANLPPEAKAKWNEALAEKNPKKKLLAFQEFLSSIPKHKGNERLRAQVKTKISDLKQEIAEQRSRRGAGKSSWSIEREGAAQVVLFGLTKAGRSSILRMLTNARPIVAEYAFSTQRPIPGMLDYEDIQFQLVELPAPQPDSEGHLQIQSQATDLIRSSAGLALIVDLTSNPFGQFESLTSALKEIRVTVERSSSRVEVVREKGSGEIRIATSGNTKSVSHAQIRELLQGYGVKNALVRVFGEISLSDVEDAILENVMLYKPCLVIGNKLDIAERESAVDFSKRIGNQMQCLLVSCLTGQGIREIGGSLFRTLGIIRVYTKEPNEIRPSDHPFVIQGGTTVKELARSIHSDLAERYRYSRIWGPTSKFAGERVGPDHVLGDMDIVEIHAY